MIENAFTLLLIISLAAFATKRLMTYLHVLQQDDYDNMRLRKWMREYRAYDKRLSLGLISLGAAWFFLPKLVVLVLSFMVFTLAAYVEIDPRRNSKKQLVATTRAKRIFMPSIITAMIFAVVWTLFVPFGLAAHPWGYILLVQALPFILMGTTLFLRPIENAVYKKYWDEAQAKMTTLNPTIIGITGSFGKTSVKHILGHILKFHAPTLMTPGSVNTPMGITRIIREQLNETHKYFIVEMGAYGQGSVANLCKLTPPNMGIITAVGHAHYERFGSLETVARAKFELAEAVLEKDEGKIIVQERILRFKYPLSLRRRTKTRERFTVCGDALLAEASGESYLSAGDVYINKIEQKADGLQINLSCKGKVYTLQAPIYGAHHAHNIALSFAAALDLGLDAEDIGIALKSLPQIPHRLEVRKKANGITYIDDAFNSNPVGFRTALDLLKILKTNGRGILITPGMVEMGGAHDDAHKTLGQHAGRICDIAVIVAGKRIPTFIEGFKETAGEDKKIIEVASFQEASDWVSANKQEGDHILIENDLPDMYERIPKM